MATLALTVYACTIEQVGGRPGASRRRVWACPNAVCPLHFSQLRNHCCMGVPKRCGVLPHGCRLRVWGKASGLWRPPQRGRSVGAHRGDNSAHHVCTSASRIGPEREFRQHRYTSDTLRCLLWGVQGACGTSGRERMHA